MDEKKTKNNSESAKDGKRNTGEGPGSGFRRIESMFGSIRGSSKSEGDLNKDLHKLTRTELLEMLVDETKEADRLRAENRRLRKELERCREDLEKVASLNAVIAKLEEIVERAGSKN